MGLCLAVSIHVVPHLQPADNIMSNDLYRYAFSVDAVNALVLKGMPFRDAYHEVGRIIASGTFGSVVQEQRVASSESSDLVSQQRTASSESKLKAHLGSIERPGLSVLRERLEDCRNVRR